MAALVYSHRFMAWAAQTFPTPYVVPSGYVAVVRDIDIWSGGGAIIQWTVAINTIARFVGGAFTVTSVQQVAQWRGRQILNAGEELTFAATGALDGAISGYLLRADLP
jgi:hypothetical protein